MAATKLYQELCYNGFRYLRASGVISNQITRSFSVKPPSVDLFHGVQVDQLAEKLNTSYSSVTHVLKQLGEKDIRRKRRLPAGIAKLVAIQLGFSTPNVKKSTSSPLSSNLQPRPPIVTVMGHVDHGKTSLLDAIRSTSVASSEAGGITQHIGAFSVTVSEGKTITFLDTPGHAAFSSMRARGATVTDIIVLVVAADDGVMPQTIESIKLAQEAKVPLVVAINKCDKHKKDIPAVMNQLLQNGIQLEEYGGDVQAVEVSAVTKQGLDTLEEAIIAQAEISDLQADPSAPVQGVVIESKTDKGRGHMATVLVQQGTLKRGCVLVTGEAWGKMRSLINYNGQTINEATPSLPVLTSGWKELPEAGRRCFEVDKESEATQIINKRKANNQRKQGRLQHYKQQSLKANNKDGGDTSTINIPLIIKGDVWGSVEALIGILESKQPNLVKLNIIHTGVGGVSDGDIEMASSTGGIVLAFNVSSTKSTNKLAMQREVTVISHNVIYKLLETLADHLEQLLPPATEEEVIGEAVVLKVFKLRGSKAPTIGGCRVKKGQLVKDGTYQIWRGESCFHEGQLVGMKRGKEDIVTAKKETECGLSLKSNNNWEEGDRVVCMKRKQVKQKLTWDVGF